MQEKIKSRKPRLEVLNFLSNPIYDHTSLRLHQSNGESRYLSCFAQQPDSPTAYSEADDLPEKINEFREQVLRPMYSSKIEISTDPNNEREKGQSYMTTEIELNSTQEHEMQDYFNSVEEKAQNWNIKYSIVPGLHSPGSHMHCGMLVKGGLDKITSKNGQYNGFFSSIIETTPTHEFKRAQRLAQGESPQQPITPRQTSQDCSPQATHARLFRNFDIFSQRPSSSPDQSVPSPESVPSPK